MCQVGKLRSGNMTEKDLEIQHLRDVLVRIECMETNHRASADENMETIRKIIRYELWGEAA